jgi:hypothetical protein
VRVGAKAAGTGGRIPMLSPWLAARLESRGFLIWEGAGGFAAGSGMIVLGLIDLKNASEAKGRDQYGLVALYRLNAVAEISVGGSAVLNGISVIARGTLLFPGIGPVILGLSLVIFAVSVAIEFEKDAPAMDWVRQCLWGKEGNYSSEAEELDNFNKALNG